MYRVYRMIHFNLKTLPVPDYSNVKKIDVHVMAHPKDKSKLRVNARAAVLEQLQDEPVNVYTFEGKYKMIGWGRAKGFRLGDSPLVSYVDDDDVIVPGIYAKILQAFKDEQRIDGLCTREIQDQEHYLNGRMGHAAHRWKYYDKRHFMRMHHITAYRRASILPFLEDIEDIPTTSEHTLVAHLMLNDARIKHLPKVGYHWCEHDNSTPSLQMEIHPKSKALYNEVWAQARTQMKMVDGKRIYVSHIPEQGFLPENFIPRHLRDD